MSESTYYECCGSFGTHTHACNVAATTSDGPVPAAPKKEKPMSDPCPFAETPLVQLRELCADLECGSFAERHAIDSQACDKVAGHLAALLTDLEAATRLNALIAQSLTTDHPDVVACMGSTPVCATWGCQLRKVAAESFCNRTDLPDALEK